MKLLSFDEIPQEKWDDFVDKSPQAWVFHLKGWMAIESKYGPAELLSFGLMSGGRLVAIQPLYCSKLGLGPFVETLIHSGLHRHTGLGFSPGIVAAEAKAARSIAMNAILEAAQIRDADRIYLAHQNLAPESLSHARQEVPFWVLDYRFELGNSFGPSGISPAPGLATTVIDQIIDLTAEENQIFSNLDESCRRAIRKGQNAELRAVDLSGDPLCIEEFWRLAQLSAQRTGEQLPDRNYYKTIQEQFMLRGVSDAIFIKSGNVFVAAAILLRYKNSCHFLAGVSDPAYLNSRVNDMLHWSALLHAKRAGCFHYRLGPYFPAVPRGWPIEKVSRFKTKFGAKPWTIVQGSRFLKPQRYCELGKMHVARLCIDPKL